MARILNSPLSAETVTFEYVPSGASTASTMTLSAANFIGGGSGIAYSAGSGISISGNTISLQSSIYNTVSNLSVTNSVVSNSTAIPTASAVYDYISTLSGGTTIFTGTLLSDVTFMSAGQSTVLTLNSGNLASIVSSVMSDFPTEIICNYTSASKKIILRAQYASLIYVNGSPVYTLFAHAIFAYNFCAYIQVINQSTSTLSTFSVYCNKFV